MDERSAAIEVHDLVKVFGDFTAVAGINFAVRTGEIFGFLGPNGSGKTTTIRMMLGLMRPTSGWAQVLGVRIDGEARQIRPRLGYMSQKFSLYNDLTVLQNLRFYAAAYGLSGAVLSARLDEALAMAGLEGRAHVRTRELSGGWRQRLALEAAILHRPEVLFLDEPTAGVDPVSRRAFWNLLEQLTRGGMTVFVTTHYMDEAEHCHRLGFLQHGHLIAYGTAAEIRARTVRGEVLEFEPSDAARAVKLLRARRDEGSLRVGEVELHGALVHVVATDIPSRRGEIERLLHAAGIQSGPMWIVEPSLEDVFISAMKA
ncbi:MAG TPA: ABC transporter ATP-binding protein [Anaerolineales bacterium]|nr:ABC transporter ATP-binding protein [Anaerolineales bacterium]